MKRALIWLLIILILGLCVRFLLPFYHSLERPPLHGPDAHYHARRTMLIVMNFPQIPAYDSYVSYPAGGYIIWPPGYDFVCASICFLFWGKNAPPKNIEWVCSIFPIFWGLLSIFVTYLICQHLFNSTSALIASFFVALLPCNSWWSALGYNDHHIVEALTIILLTYFFIKKSVRTTYDWIWVGLTMGIGMLFWQGAILFAGLVFFLVMIFREFKALIAYVISLLIILPFSVKTHFVDSPFSYRGLSMLHIVLLVIAILILACFLIIQKKHKILVFVPLVGLIILLFFLLNEKGFWGGLTFVTKRDPWLESILEFKPLVIQGNIIETITLKSLYGYSFYVWPLGLFMMLWENRKKAFYIFGFFVVFTGVMAFFARRYSVWFSPFYAVILGYIILRIYKLILDITRKILVGLIFCLGLCIIILIPVITYGYNKIHWTYHSKNSLAAYQWLSDSTPSTSYYNRPVKKPEYGIMCSWTDGHNIIYHARRPVAMSNFGNDVPNFSFANSFFVSENESLANQVMDSLNCRYVFLANWQYDLNCMVRYLRKSLSEYFDFFQVRDNYGINQTMMVPTIKGYSVAISRLYRFLGSGAYMEGVYFPPYRHYRLRYISDDGSIRIFEYIKGAVIKGRNKSRSSVRLTLPVKIGYFSFVYQDSLATDDNGEFVTTVPYGTDSLNPYVLEINGKESRMIISNTAVNMGDTIIFSFPR